MTNDDPWRNPRRLPTHHLEIQEEDQMAWEQLEAQLQVRDRLVAEAIEKGDAHAVEGIGILTRQDVQTLSAQCERYKCLHTDVHVGEPAWG